MSVHGKNCIFLVIWEFCGLQFQPHVSENHLEGGRFNIDQPKNRFM